MKLSDKLIPLLAALLLGACASKPPEPTRLDLQGFSIGYPRTDKDDPRQWAVVQKLPGQLMAAKPGDFDGETYTLQALVVKLPPLAGADQLLQHVRATQTLDPKRFRVLRTELVPHPVGTETCALLHLEAEDRSSTSISGPAVNMLLQTLTLTCAHPKDRMLGINVSYIHRHFPEDKDPRFLETGTALLDTLEFTAP